MPSHTDLPPVPPHATGSGQGRRDFLVGSAVSVAAGLCAGPARAAPMGDPVAETADGRLRGRQANGAISFKGVPYAADTGGANRFMAPRPVRKWAGVRDAFAYGDTCPQETGPGGGGDNEPRAGENCCVLNVYTTGLGFTHRRPVMVYIHGGGFSRGSGSGAALEGSNLARFGDVVVVTINHRLNVFGYTTLGHLHPDFADSSNAGQLDIIAALRWVRRNIAAFGGDPANVTLFGESGGGAKIAALSVMPAANSLYRRNINMSGPGAFFMLPSASAEEVTNETLKGLGLGKGDLRRLQDVPHAQLLAAQVEAIARLKADQSRPTVDGRHIHHAPMSAEGIRMQAAVPGILSSTATEAMPWVLRDRANLQISDAQLQQRIQAQFGMDAEKAAGVMAGYRADTPGRTAWDILVALTSDAMIRTPMRRAAEARANAGRAPVYLCDFTWKSPVEGGIWQGPHAIDVPMAFGNPDKNRLTNVPDPSAMAASRNLMAIYIAFARSGVPDARGLPHWPAFDTAARHSMLIDATCQAVTDYRASDRKTADTLPVQKTFELTDGALVKGA